MSELKPVVTPVGELFYVNISGQGKQNYNEDGYNYVATVHLSGKPAEKLKQEIEEVLGPVPAGKTVKSRGYRELYKDKEGKLFTPTSNRKVTDEDTKTDLTAFTFSTSTTFADGKPKKINVFNKNQGKVELGDRKIGNGSRGAISGKMKQFVKGKEMGVSLFLNAVQITQFIPYEGDAGFEAQDEGDFEGFDDADENFQNSAAAEPAPAKEKAKPKL